MFESTRSVYLQKSKKPGQAHIKCHKITNVEGKMMVSNNRWWVANNINSGES